MAVNQWQGKGRIWNELAAVRDVRYQPDREKGPRLTMELFDGSGARRAKMWTPTEIQAGTVLEAQDAEPPLLRVCGTVETAGPYAGEVTVDGVFPVTPDDAEAAAFTIAAPLPDDHALRTRDLDRLISGVREPHLAALLAQTIGTEGTLREDYLRATAAKKNHHAYAGGLLRHSVEVARLAFSAARDYPSLLHRDLLITAALLHDIGKLWEMEQSEWRRGQYTEDGELLGHIFLGGSLLDRCCRTLHFPRPLRSALLHLVLSHHEQKEHGSPVTPLSAEAVILAKCDQISAELARYEEGGGHVWSWQTAALEALRAAVPTDLLPDDPEERLLRRLTGLPPEDPDSPASPPADARMLPILGVVAAGDGVRSSAEGPEPEWRAVLPPAEGGADFLLRVTGDSMIGAGILEGDLLLVRRQESARPGQIVVAQVPDVGPVVKRLAASSDGMALASENAGYPPIPVTEDVRVQGIVVRVERDL